MYAQFYGLRESPFALTPDPRYLFMSEPHKEALASAIYGVQERKGFVLILGEVGTGKTTLLNLIAGIDRPDAGSVSVAGTDVTTLSESQLAKWRAIAKTDVPAFDKLVRGSGVPAVSATREKKREGRTELRRAAAS